MVINSKKVRNNLIFNFMLDIRKEKFDPLERATLINEYIKESGKSKRGLAKELGIPHTTIEGWLAWAKVTKEEKDKLEHQGLTQTQILDNLKCSKVTREQRMNANYYFNKELETINSKIKSYERSIKYDNETLTLIQKTKDNLNRVLMYMEKKK